MIEGLLPWFEVNDPDQREAMAARVHGEMDSLTNQPGWHRLVNQVEKRIQEHTHALVRDKREDDILRGKIAALTAVISMPDKTRESANTELAKYRGN